MPQTLLAIAAIFAITLYAFNQHRAGIQLERDAFLVEIEQAATDVARSHLHSVAERAFDEVDIGSTAIRFDATGLTAPLGPEAGETAALYDDVDDFHHDTTTVTPLWDGQPLTFQRVVQVRYVQPTNPAAVSAAPTTAKEVTVIVFEDPATVLERRPVRVQLRKVVTPTFRTLHG